jgi:hypothetical protein
MRIYVSREEFLADLVVELSTIWIVRKHPPMPLRMPGHLKAFTIHKIYHDFKSAKTEAKKRNEKSSYLFTVTKVKLKGKL